MIARVVGAIGRGLGALRGWGPGAVRVTWIARAWRPRSAAGLPQWHALEQPPEALARWASLDQARVCARAEARLARMNGRMRSRYGASTHGLITGSQRTAQRIAAFKSGLQIAEPVDGPDQLGEFIIWYHGELPSPER